VFQFPQMCEIYWLGQKAGAEISAGLGSRDKERKLQTVRYEAVNTMLLNEFLKEHRKMQEQGTTIAELKKEIANLTATVKQQASQIQKVNAQLATGRVRPTGALEARKSSPQIVLNNQ
jgi:hypothetical protein